MVVKKNDTSGKQIFTHCKFSDPNSFLSSIFQRFVSFSKIHTGDPPRPPPFLYGLPYMHLSHTFEVHTHPLIFIPYTTQASYSIDKRHQQIFSVYRLVLTASLPVLMFLFWFLSGGLPRVLPTTSGSKNNKIDDSG